MTTSNFSNSFNITDIAFRGVPVVASVFNEFDYFGSLLGLQRLPEEKNTFYKKRLLDVFTNRANSTYTGLINGITRELGLELFQPITITLNTGVTTSPRIEFIDNTVYVYSDINTLELTINRGSKGSGAYFLTELVDSINNSTVFSASLINPEYAWLRSDTVLNQNNLVLIENQGLISSQFNYLENANIQQGSVVFSDLNAFKYEVSSLSEVSRPGRFYINYLKGQVTSYSIPADGSISRFYYLQSVFTPIASPVIIRSFNSGEFNKLIFNQILQADDTTIDSLPTGYGASIINTLLSVTPTYWGP